MRYLSSYKAIVHSFSVLFLARFVATVFLCLLVITALFADFLSSEKPVYIVYNNKSYYPLFASKTACDSLPNTRSGKQTWQSVAEADWKHIPYQKAIWTLCPFDTKYTGKLKLQPPFSHEKTENQVFTHYFGTDRQDIDVLASIIQGTKTSLSVGIGGLLLMAFLGIGLGGMAGYFGDTKWVLTRGQKYGIFMGIFLGFFYGFYIPRFNIEAAFLSQNVGQAMLYILVGIGILIGTIFLFAWIGKKMGFISFLNQKTAFPIDKFITQLTDIQMALPVILIVIALSLMLPRSLFSLILIIGFSYYMGIARLTRSLASQVRNLPYIEAAEALGLSQIRILTKHILPNVLPPLISILLLSLADLILLEAAFSFINIGLPIETVSWGKILNQARDSPDSWWLSVFPALMIAGTAGSLKIVAHFRAESQ